MYVIQDARSTTAHEQLVNKLRVSHVMSYKLKTSAILQKNTRPTHSKHNWQSEVGEHIPKELANELWWYEVKHHRLEVHY